MSASEVASIVASVVGIILAIIAIWQAMYFYTQAKGSEARVQAALEGIRSQTDALKALSARQMDRLTKYATTPREEPNQTAQLLADTMRDIPNIVLRLMPPPQPSGKSASRSEQVHLYIALWNYIATSNVWGSFMLPRPQEFDDSIHFHRLTKHIVDRSAGDFQFMSSIVDDIPRSEIEACNAYYIDLYNEVQTHLRKTVGDTAHYFAQSSHDDAP